VEREAALRSTLEQVPQSKTGPSVGVSFPRYVRVNTLLTDFKQAVSSLQSQYYEQLYVDAHVPDLLVLPPGTSLHGHQLVTSGKVVLQDKSSCFSALCLIHGSNQFLEGDYLDACAAPGNKTSHLVALIAQRSQTTNNTVFALDRSSTRCELLQRRMEQLVPTKKSRVVTQHLDFLKTDPSDYPSVRGILLDPSCSGSGIFTSPDRQAGEVNDPSRMEPLSNFQLVALKHGMAFPQVKRIVYSTCSLHEQENEGVVLQALQVNPDWQLVAPACLKHWKRRGRRVAGLTVKQAQCLIRADRGDETNGFFVAYLERKSITSEETDSLGQTLKIVNRQGLAVYNGEFSTEVTNMNESDTEDTSETLMEDSRRREALTAPTVAESEINNEKTRAASKEKVVGKKRAKKLAWKQNQMEQKIRRIEKRKGNAAATGADDAS
jgi:putative methyltransferase